MSLAGKIVQTLIDRFKDKRRIRMLKQKVCTDDVNPKPTKKKQYMEKKPVADILLCLQIHPYLH